LKVLVIDREPPIYARHGNALIAMEVFRRLHAHELTLVAPVSPGDRDRAADELRSTFRDVHLVPRRQWTPAIAGSIESRFAGRVGWVPTLDMPVASALATRVRHLVQELAFDVVHVRQLPMAGYRRFGPDTPALLELVDSETLGAERVLPRSLRTRLRAAAARFVESRAMRDFDVITAVADADAERLRRLDPSARVEVVPNGVDAAHFASAPPVERAPATLVFVGAMSFPPNVAAMVRFAHESLPLVRRERPDARLLIVGRDPSRSILALCEIPGVEITGEVEDVRPYLAASTIFVAPMVSGSGIKNKVLEALAASCAVVATPLAVDGLPIRNGEHAVIANSGHAFAAAILDLLARPHARTALGRAGRDLVADRYTWERCASRYDALYIDRFGWHTSCRGSRNSPRHSCFTRFSPSSSSA
jgi:glycosyltransferase involved in cell wall biosynthesis